MTIPGLRLRHLLFLGPDRPSASIHFGPGLNVLFGASETGKSFVVQAIDFMLGGHTALRDIPERVGYDRVLLGVETLDGETFTLQRSTDGGAFRMSPGLRLDALQETADVKILGDQHNEKRTDNLSMFLLERCGLAGKRLRRNRLGETNSLSFRHLARLVVIDETSIMATLSPLSDGNPSLETTNLSALKLLLTGVDDSALEATAPSRDDSQSRESQMSLLDQLIVQQRARLKHLTPDPSDVAGQLERIEATLSRQANALTLKESDYKRLVSERRELRKRVEDTRDRQAEISALLERFALLERHYVSDIARLQSIQEGGTLFEVMGTGPCPLCGADPQHHRRDGGEEVNVGAVVAAAGAEISQIELLRRELKTTVAELQREAMGFDRLLPRLEQQLRAVSEQVEQMITPELARLRTSYRELADKRGHVQTALSVLENVKDLEGRREKLEQGENDPEGSTITPSAVPASVAEGFGQAIETILADWHFPGPERVFFDQAAKDLIIAGKARMARGKGLRAITHAAFTIGVLEYCRQNATPHPGFVVLDSPLLAYKEPEGNEDDLRGTDLQDRFYAFLGNLPDDRQVLVVENVEPPEVVRRRDQVTVFTGNPHTLRYGFFPTSGQTAPISEVIPEDAKR
jgi:predicted nuclease with TOPRIM domain